MKAIIASILIVLACAAGTCRAEIMPSCSLEEGASNATDIAVAEAKLEQEPGAPSVSSAKAKDGPSDSVHFAVELTDGARILGEPVNASFPWKTDAGSLTLKWDLLKSIEKVGGGAGFTIALRNGDRTEGTPEANTFTLRASIGDLTVPFALTQRIRIDARAGEGVPAAYWSFNDPAHLGADDSGNGHTLTVKGAQPTEGRIGKGAATGGPGYGNHFMADSHPDLQFSGDFTLAVWAWRSKPMWDGDQIIAKEGEFSLRRYQIPTERYDVELCDKHGLQIAKVSDTKSGLPLEEWTLIIVSRKDDRLSIRVNNLPAVDVKVARGEVGGDKPLYVGSSVVGYPWQGKMDEIKKWNRALSEEEQRELFRDAPAK